MTERRILGKFGGEYYGSRIGAFGVVLRDLVFSSEYTMIDRIKYFDALKVPRKQLVWFERSAHMPNTEERDTFNAFMIDTVRPGQPE
jgi:hypothetical protein